MASRDYLMNQMKSAREEADDNSKPSIVRHAAEHRFWNCVRRIETLDNLNMQREHDYTWATKRI